jgi:phage recombination protein Bet
MNNDLQTTNTNMNLWEDAKVVNEIRKLFAPKLTDLEFQFFLGLGKATQLNPFLREIWSVKYADNSPAQVFIGRDGYRKAAQAHLEYDYHQCDAVYENDQFCVENGEVSHSYKLVNRGALVGAYCITKRHKSSKPIFVFVELKEYTTGKSLWNPQTGKPATMIKKVAESQCLRACFQDLLGGTYSEEEMQKTSEPKSNNSKTLMDKITAAKSKDVEDESEVIEMQAYAKPEQLKEIHALMAVKVFETGRLKSALDHYKVDTIGQLSEIQADDFISKLNRLADKE